MNLNFDEVLENSVGCSLSQIINFLENNTNIQFMSRFLEHAILKNHLLNLDSYTDMMLQHAGHLVSFLIPNQIQSLIVTVP